METVTRTKTKHVITKMIDTKQGHLLRVKYIRKHTKCNDIPNNIRFSISLAPKGHIKGDFFGKTEVRKKLKKMLVKCI
jgi:hypothetical protein